MQKEDCSLAERFLHFIGGWLTENRIPFLSSVFFGLLAYGFAFTNKLPNHDDVLYLFGKGATADSGRWGLELLRIIIPDYSLPWLHGIISLLLLSVAICIILNLFQLRNILSRVLLPALIICFPSQIGTFCYMYTSSCYAVAFLLAVLAVWGANQPGIPSKIFSVLCITLMLSIYQAYLSIVAGLMVLLLIRMLLISEPADGESSAAGKAFLVGVLDLLLIAAALLLYVGTVRLYQQVSGIEYNAYSNELMLYAPGFPKGIPVAYRMFLYNLTSRYNMLLVSKTSRLLHFIALLITGAGVFIHLLRKKKPLEVIFLLLLLLLLPVCICGLYIVIYWAGIHTLVLYGYIILYVLMFLVAETLPETSYKILLHGMKDVLVVSLAAVIGINICFANRTFLKLHLAYENAYSLATTLVTQLRSIPGYERDTPVAIYPSAGSALRFSNHFGDEEMLSHDLMGAQFQLLTGYTEQAFLEYYIGADVNLVSHEQADRLAHDERCRQMPVYPDSGSISVIDGTVFVKFEDLPDDTGVPFVYKTTPFG